MVPTLSFTNSKLLIIFCAVLCLHFVSFLLLFSFSQDKYSVAERFASKSKAYFPKQHSCFGGYGLDVSNSPCFLNRMALQTNGGVALLGGGPSSVIPLVMLSSFERISYYGNPWESLVLAGRDPQKTILMMLKVARKYKTNENLVREARFYYEYICETAQTFSLDLQTALDRSYNWLPQGNVVGDSGDSLVRHKETGKLLIMRQEGEDTFYLKGKWKGKIPADADYLKVKDDSIFLKSEFWAKDSEGKPFLLAAGKHCFLYPPKSHGDFHYVGLFSSLWKERRLFKENNYAIIINRAGFNYPDNFASKLLAGLNVDFAYSVSEILSYMKTKTELQLNLLALLKNFITNNRIYSEMISDTAFFIIIGAGRAAGEVSRRLTNDIIHQTKPGEFLKAVTSDIKSVSNLKDFDFEAKLRNRLMSRRKRVVTIDHKRINPASEEQVTTLLSNKAYQNYLLELTKFDFVPTLSPEDIEYYRQLLKSIKSVLRIEKKKKEYREHTMIQYISSIVTVFFDSLFGRTMDGSEEFDESIVSTLEKLIRQENADPNFLLISCSSRVPQKWTKTIWGNIRKHFGDDFEDASNLREDDGRDKTPAKPLLRIVGIGGASQAGPGILKYDLEKMQKSHYRRENLEFLTFICSEKSKRFETFAAQFMEYLTSQNRNENCSTETEGDLLEKLGIVCVNDTKESKL